MKAKSIWYIEKQSYTIYKLKGDYYGKSFRSKKHREILWNRSNLTKAIDNISFDVEKGEFVGIMGASGSGKSTLLNVISTIDKVTAGKIIVNGEEITKLREIN